MGSSSGNSYTKFVIIGMKFRFTCGQSDLYSNFLKSLIIMANIAGLLEYAELNTEVYLFSVSNLQ